MFACIAVKEWETHSSLTRIVRNEKYFWVVTVTRLRDFGIWLVSGCSDVGGMTSPPAGPHLAAHTWRRRRSKHRENIREVADKRPSADVWPGGGNVAMGRGKYWGLRGYTEAGVSQVWLQCGHQGWGPGRGEPPLTVTSLGNTGPSFCNVTPHTRPQWANKVIVDCVQSMTNLPVCSTWRSAFKSTSPRDTWQPRVRGSCDVAHL